MQKVVPFILIDPNEILRFTINENQFSCTITIKNVYNKHIAFKVKSNAPNFYKVYPSKGLLSKGENITLVIKANIIQEVVDHSFMIISKPVSGTESSFQILWNEKNEKPQKNRLKVKFDESEIKENIEKEKFNQKLKALQAKKQSLKIELKNVIEELKSKRINLLKTQCENNLEYGYQHAIGTFIAGFLFSVFLINFL